MDSLTAFYEANPAFFREIFIPTYLGCVYLTTGLRESCRTFARMIAQPKRCDSIFIAHQALASGDIALGNLACEKQQAAHFIFMKASEYDGPNTDAICREVYARWKGDKRVCCISTCATKIMAAAHLPLTARDILKDAHEGDFGLEMLWHTATCAGDHVLTLIEQLHRICNLESKNHLENVMLARHIAMNSGPHAIEITKRLLRDPGSSLQSCGSTILRNEGPCAPELLKMADLSDEIVHEFFGIVLQNKGPHVFELMNILLSNHDAPHPYVGYPSLINSEDATSLIVPFECLCSFAAFNAGPKALELYRFWEARGYANECDIVVAACNMGPMGPAICAYILKKKPTDQSIMYLKQAIQHSLDNIGEYVLEIFDILWVALLSTGISEKEATAVITDEWLMLLASRSANVKMCARVVQIIEKYRPINYDELLRAGARDAIRGVDICRFAIEHGATDGEGALRVCNLTNHGGISTLRLIAEHFSSCIHPSVWVELRSRDIDDSIADCARRIIDTHSGAP